MQQKPTSNRIRQELSQAIASFSANSRIAKQDKGKYANIRFKRFDFDQKFQKL